MKAWIISDIHRSPSDAIARKRLDVPRADICVCAGDISDDIERSIAFLLDEVAPYMTVVATLGNHDYYGGTIDYALAYARKVTAGTNVHILEDEIFVRGDLRVIGATLWTDFLLDAHEAGYLPPDERRNFAIRECMRYLVDFRLIRQSATRPGHLGGLISAQEMISRHLHSRSYIEQQLAVPFEGTTIVLTHHAISPRSLDPRFDGHVTNAVFASDLSAVIRSGRPHFWIHGHIHRSVDYVEGDTRVISNTHGYPREAGANGFRPGLIIETRVSGGEEGDSNG